MKGDSGCGSECETWRSGCVCCVQENTVLFRVAVVRSEDASVCLCCQGTPVWPVSSTFSLSMESKVVFSADMEGFRVRVGDSKVCTRASVIMSDQCVYVCACVGVCVCVCV